MLRFVSFIPLLFALLAIALVQQGGVDNLTAFRTTRSVLQYGGVFLFAGGILMYFLKRKDESVWWVMGGAGAIIIVAILYFTATSYPFINDYTSDLDNPPTYIAIAQLPENSGKDLSFPSENKAIIKAAYPEPLFILSQQPKADVFDKVRGLVLENRWTAISADLNTGTVEAVITSPLFKFQDDFIVRITEQENPKGLRIDFRSKSRVGKSDLGANIKRIKKFKSDLEIRL